MNEEGEEEEGQGRGEKGAGGKSLIRASECSLHRITLIYIGDRQFWRFFESGAVARDERSQD